MTVDQMLIAFKELLARKLAAPSNQDQFDPGTETVQTEDGFEDVPGDFTWSEEIQERAANAVTAVVGYVLKEIWPKYPPTHRRGSGRDGGRQEIPGEPFDLD
jgi:hypothetical protein